MKVCCSSSCVVIVFILLFLFFVYVIYSFIIFSQNLFSIHFFFLKKKGWFPNATNDKLIPCLHCLLEKMKTGGRGGGEERAGGGEEREEGEGWGWVGLDGCVVGERPKIGGGGVGEMLGLGGRVIVPEVRFLFFLFFLFYFFFYCCCC